MDTLPLTQRVDDTLLRCRSTFQCGHGAQVAQCDLPLDHAGTHAARVEWFNFGKEQERRDGNWIE